MSSEEQFWNWFKENEGELFDFETDREAMFDRIAEQLHKVDPDLTFEFGPKRAGSREFVISAGGMKLGFPAVTSLVESAPSLSRWHVIAFRPRRHPMNVLQLGGKTIDPQDVEFSLLDDGKNAGVYLFIPGFRDVDVDMKQIGYLLLDEALGEYDVESKVALIKMFSPEVRTDGVRYPLAELPMRFDQLIRRLGSNTG
jgi:hypothetical protein